MSFEARKGSIRRKPIKALLLDLDGTLYFRGAQIPDARQTLESLRKLDFGLRFLTNIDSKTADTLQRKVAAMGLAVEEEEIFSAVSAGLHFLRRHPDKRSYCLVSQKLTASFAPFLGDGMCRRLCSCRRLSRFRELRNAEHGVPPRYGRR